MLTISKLRKIFCQKKFYPKKKLGQSFLIDGNIQKKILQSCELSRDDTILEIGAGLGQLTEDLTRKVKKAYAVEKDKVLSQWLRENLGSFKNLEIIERDILEFPLPFKTSPLNLKFKVIGNLPYYIATPILTRLIEDRRTIDSIYVTLQKELAQRIIAAPGGKEYSAFTVFVNYYTCPKILFPIKRTCFYPQPEVDSCFMKLEVLSNPRVKVKSEELFFYTVRSTFQKRRKTLLNSLAKGRLNLSKKTLLNILEEAQIEPQSRPEILSIMDFARLTQTIDRHIAHNGLL